MIAVGDSFNDITMLREADHGILFRAPDAVARAFPQFPVTQEYPDLRARIEAAVLAPATGGTAHITA